MKMLDLLCWGCGILSLISALLFGLEILDPLSPADMCMFLYVQMIIVIYLLKQNLQSLYDEGENNGEDQKQD